jgi:MFS transporter, ACS family, tartrate transporter
MSPIDLEQRTMAKVAWKLLPFLCVCYMAAFLDRVNVGFAKVQMVADLGFSNAVYGLGAGIFFLGYFLLEVPSNLILERVGARLWIARIMVVWGIISFCMIFVSKATHFYLIRFLLGAAEAGFFPGIILYLTYWFPRDYRSRTIAVFMTAAVMSSVIGSPVSGLLLALDGVLGQRGYKWLFIVEAVPSIVLGVAVFFLLPKGPAEAKWLKPDELDWLSSKLAAERAELERAHKPSLGEALMDRRVLVLCLVYFSVCVGGYGLDFFQPTLVHQAFPAATPAAVGFINALPQLICVFVMVVYGRSSDRRGERHMHFALSMWTAAAGLALASLPLPAWLALVALSVAVSGRWSSIAPFWGLPTTFFSGAAAAGAIALINATGNLGGFVGPYLMGWLKDATGDYRIGLRALSAMMFIGGFVVFAVRSRATSSPRPLSPP